MLISLLLNLTKYSSNWMLKIYFYKPTELTRYVLIILLRKKKKHTPSDHLQLEVFLNHFTWVLPNYLSLSIIHWNFVFNSVGLLVVVCLYFKSKWTWDDVAYLWLFSSEDDYGKLCLKASSSITFLQGPYAVVTRRGGASEGKSSRELAWESSVGRPR